MLKLGVNIDHIATLRQARRTTYPSLVQAAHYCEKAGAHGITIHLREDRRHIQDADVYALRTALKTRMNLEMANHPDIVAVALAVHPEEVCLVPERRAELTTEGGLDVAGQRATLRPVIQKLQQAGISVSLFIDPDRHQVEAAADLQAPYIELHTGAYAEKTGAPQAQELERLCLAAEYAHDLNLRVNAGHGLTLDNITPILKLPYLDTLNIGHSIVCDALFIGLEEAVTRMLSKMKG